MRYVLKACKRCIPLHADVRTIYLPYARRPKIQNFLELTSKSPSFYKTVLLKTVAYEFSDHAHET